jgi:lysophospholipase L1-like esterase
MSNTQHEPDHCFQYTALGDSIAFGVGATDNYGYVYYFRDFLATIYSCVKLTKRARPGFTSSELLHQLQKNATTRAAVKNADLITLSIGGADLLNNCLLTNDIPTCLSKAVATFVINWPLIMNEIRKSIRSHAEIFIMTVYNPFRGDEPNYNMIDFFIQQINHVIKSNRFTYHYKVIDVHNHFQGQFTGNTQWKVCTWTHFCEIPVSPTNPGDPHPTASGHLEIARLHELKYLKYHPHEDGSNDESSS